MVDIAAVITTRYEHHPQNRDGKRHDDDDQRYPQTPDDDPAGVALHLLPFGFERITYKYHHRCDICQQRPSGE